MAEKKTHIPMDDEEVFQKPEGTEDEIVEEDDVEPVAEIEDPDIVDEDLPEEDRLPEDAIQNKDGSVTLPLKYPQVVKSRKNGEVRSRNFAELRFYRLSGKDQRIVSSVERQEDTIPTAFARSTRLNQKVMNNLYDKMDSHDIMRAGQVLNHFLATGPRTGRKS